MRHTLDISLDEAIFHLKSFSIRIGRGEIRPVLASAEFRSTRRLFDIMSQANHTMYIIRDGSGSLSPAKRRLAVDDRSLDGHNEDFQPLGLA